jgi:hypothetical protein
MTNILQQSDTSSSRATLVAIAVTCHKNLWHQSTVLRSGGRNTYQRGRHKGTTPQSQQCRPARGPPFCGCP